VRVRISQRIAGGRSAPAHFAARAEARAREEQGHSGGILKLFHSFRHVRSRLGNYRVTSSSPQHNEGVQRLVLSSRRDLYGGFLALQAIGPRGKSYCSSSWRAHFATAAATGSSPLFVKLAAAAGEARNAISASPATGSLAAVAIPAENTVIFCTSGGNCPTKSHALSR